jgi:hypothetical protein
VEIVLARLVPEIAQAGTAHAARRGSCSQTASASLVSVPPARFSGAAASRLVLQAHLYSLASCYSGSVAG